jgi:two-component system response regulator FixJ
LPERAGQLVVYILESDESVRRAFSRLMRSAGIEARAYSRPDEFLAEVDNESRGVILLDIGLPSSVGNEVLGQLREARISLPVIVLSAHDDDASQQTARELGARMLLHKPTDNQALLDAIEWLGGAHAAR